MPDRVGLTGARGVLGARIRDAFAERGLEPVAFDGDVRDADAVMRWAEPLPRIVHAAAIVPVQQVDARPGVAIGTNVAGAANVARAAAGRPLAFISTSHVYRASPAPLTEDDPIDPVSRYGLSKWQGEQWVRAIAPDALVMRVFSYFDPRQQPSYLVPALRARIGAAPRDAVLPLHGADSVRDLADAGWLAERCVDLVVAGATGTVNCCTGRGYRVGEVAARLARAMGRDDLRWQPAGDGAPNSLVGSSERLAALLGPLPGFDLDRALARFVAEAAPRDPAGSRFS